ncbi:MAG: lysophospholipid acyltransferase family protein [Anaerolineae bacterium]
MGNRSLRREEVPLGRRILMPVLHFLLWLLVRVSVEGLEHIPKEGPTIVIINHVHILDPVVVVAAIRRYMVPLSKAEALEWPFLGLLLKWFPVIPVHRGEIDMGAMRWSDRVLGAGQGLIIAPEGTRSRTGALQRPKAGFVFLAKRHDAIIVPAAVTGATEFPQVYRRLRRPHIHVRFGEPFRFRWPTGGRLDRDTMDRMADAAMYRIADLLPAEMRGLYAEPSPEAEAWLRPVDENEA